MYGVGEFIPKTQVEKTYNFFYKAKHPIKHLTCCYISIFAPRYGNY